MAPPLLRPYLDTPTKRRRDKEPFVGRTRSATFRGPMVVDSTLSRHRRFFRVSNRRHTDALPFNEHG
jgi:hypothetical protein